MRDKPCAGAAGAGLVLLGTSDTQTREPISPGDELCIPACKAEADRKRLRKMRTGVVGVSKAIQDAATESGFRFRVAMITLTYRDDVEWHARHVSNTLKCYREWARRRKISIHYVWVMELTKRGVPHYHILIWVPRGYTPPLPDKQGWWKHGHTQVCWARSPVGYIAKYASKGVNGHALPKGARVWDTGGLNKHLVAIRSWLMAPSWLKPFVPFGHRVRKHAESWWEDMRTGSRFRSPWLFLGMKDGCLWLRYLGFKDGDILLFGQCTA